MKLITNRNWKATASAFALTALIVLGTAATHATTVGQTANNAKNVAPPEASNAQSIASAPLPQDLTVTPSLKMDAYAGALPGGASAVHAVFITTEKKKVDVPLLSASLITTEVNANLNANNEVNAAPAPDIAAATANLNAATNAVVNANVHSIALTPKTEVALASNDATAANIASAANIGDTRALNATTGAGAANTRSKLADLNPNNVTTAANFNQSDHDASLNLSASLKSEDATNGNNGTTFANTAGSSVIS